MPNPRAIKSLRVEDLQIYAVWEFVSEHDGHNETWVKPVETLPVRHLNGRLAATPLEFADGSSAWALLGNIDTSNPKTTEHFVTISVERDGSWLHLARYFDHDYVERRPAALATFLRSKVDDIFPIRFDLRHLAIGDAGSLIGEVPKEPKERLARDQLLRLVVP